MDKKLREITRLNLAIELVSECAGLVDTDAVARVVGQRLRWLFDFGSCILALRVGDQLCWLGMRSGDEGLSAAPDGLGDASRALVEAVMESGTPSASGSPMLAIAHPLGNPDRPLGALCIQGDFLHAPRPALPAPRLRGARGGSCAHRTVGPVGGRFRTRCRPRPRSTRRSPRRQ